MTKIIDSDQTFRTFDFSSIIKPNDVDDAIEVIERIIAEGNYFENSPKYQTKENIFQRQEPCWLKFRMSFIFACFMYLGREAKISNMMAWSFMTNLHSSEDREKLWHHHHHKPNTNMLSGIMYLHIPDDVTDRDTCGTEMAPNGLDAVDRVFVRPYNYTWLIYPSSVWHRPGIVQSNKYRFVLAGDLEYQ
jgi:hypothetical protein